MNPQLFRKKPVTVEAVQWTGDNLQAFENVFPHLRFRLTTLGRTLCLETYVGDIAIWPNQWLIKDDTKAKGFEILENKEFTATYEPVEERV